MPGVKIINNSSEITLANKWIPSTKFNSKDRLVDANGREISSDYKGRQYRIIEKRERIFSIPERIGRGLLGTLAVACTLFLGLFSKHVRNLFIKPKENVRFGVLVSPSSNLPSQIASSISISTPPGSQGKVDPVKVKTHQIPLTVSPQKPNYVEPLLPIDISSYRNLSPFEAEVRAGLEVAVRSLAEARAFVAKKEANNKVLNEAWEKARAKARAKIDAKARAEADSSNVSESTYNWSTFLKEDFKKIEKKINDPDTSNYSLFKKGVLAGNKPSQLLGLSPKHTKEKIKKAYVELALQLHPDKNPDKKEEAQVLFNCLNQARALLESTLAKSE